MSDLSDLTAAEWVLLAVWLLVAVWALRNLLRTPDSVLVQAYREWRYMRDHGSRDGYRAAARKYALVLALVPVVLLLWPVVLACVALAGAVRLLRSAR